MSRPLSTPNDVATLHLGEQRFADWPIFDRDRTGYAALDQPPRAF
jgi:hypothetical protein